MAKFVCNCICGYVYEGEAARQSAHLPNAPAESFVKQEGEMTWVFPTHTVRVESLPSGNLSLSLSSCSASATDLAGQSQKFRTGPFINSFLPDRYGNDCGQGGTGRRTGILCRKVSGNWTTTLMTTLAKYWKTGECRKQLDNSFAAASRKIMLYGQYTSTVELEKGTWRAKIQFSVPNAQRSMMSITRQSQMMAYGLISVLPVPGKSTTPS